MIVQPTRTAHKPVFRSWTGSHVKLHDKGNHGPWLSIALFLADMPRREAAPASAAKRSAAEAGAALGAALSGGPDGNHGENNFSTASTAQEVRS